MQDSYRHFSPIIPFNLLSIDGSALTFPSFVPWALSFVNGMAILGFLFARLYQLLPGRNGATKGLAFGLIGWMLMGLVFFPVIGLGPFAFGARLGIAPTLLSLAMLLTYSVVLGTVYAALDTGPLRKETKRSASHN